MSGIYYLCTFFAYVDFFAVFCVFCVCVFFRFACLKVTEDEIANAAGISDTHDGVNFMRAACVIAVEKVGACCKMEKLAVPQSVLIINNCCTLYRKVSNGFSRRACRYIVHGCVVWTLQRGALSRGPLE